MFLSSTLSITGSIYSSTSLNRIGKPYLMASSSCFRKSGSLKVTTWIKMFFERNVNKCDKYTGKTTSISLRNKWQYLWWWQEIENVRNHKNFPSFQPCLHGRAEIRNFSSGEDPKMFRSYTNKFINKYHLTSYKYCVDGNKLANVCQTSKMTSKQPYIHIQHSLSSDDSKLVLFLHNRQSPAVYWNLYFHWF